MPNIYIENRDRWEQLSAVDYLGAFVNAWLAFNAWYRSAYNENQDRKIINEFKWQPSVVRSKIIPLLTASSEEAEQLRADVGLLHHRLENFHLHSGKDPNKERITLTNVYLRENVPTSQTTNIYGLTFEVSPGGAGVSPKQVTSKVSNRRGAVLLFFTQPSFDPAELEANADFQSNLNANQRGQLLALYRNVNPKIIGDLLTMGQLTPIKCGAHDFKCTPDELFAGFGEVIYLLRCCLFHGELVPSREASACYEPAYHIVRRFLQSIA
jgi:hypothetical protein